MFNSILGIAEHKIGKLRNISIKTIQSEVKRIKINFKREEF